MKRLLKTKEAAEYLGLSVRTLENWRYQGRGPKLTHMDRTVRKAIPELGGTVLHDLRHTFASIGDDLGLSPATIAALLGHAAKTQTGRYTHKFSPELATAAQRIGGHISGLLGLDRDER